MVMAEIYAMLGENDKSLDELEILLSIPSMCPPRLLEADPIFASVVKTPRFKELARSFNPQPGCGSQVR